MAQAPAGTLNAAFRPQPWEQCAQTLRDSGHPNEAKAVLIAKEEAARAAGKIAPVARPFHWLYGALVAYGHKPQRILWALGAAWLVAGSAYWIGANPSRQFLGAPHHLFEPTAAKPSFACADRRRAAEEADARPLKHQVPQADYGSFVPFLYSLDHQVPVINIGHRAE